MTRETCQAVMRFLVKAKTETRIAKQEYLEFVHGICVEYLLELER